MDSLEDGVQMDESGAAGGVDWKDIPFRPLEIIVAKACPATMRLVNCEWRDAVNRCLTELQLTKDVSRWQVLRVTEKFPRIQQLVLVLEDRVLSKEDPANTPLQEISDSAARLQYLRKLVIRSGRKSPVLDIQLLAALTKVKFLDIRRIEVANFEFLSSFKDLTGLELCGCKIQEQHIKVISSLKNLKHLGLGRATAHPDVLHGMMKQHSGLTYLDIRNTRVTDESLRGIKSLTQLQHLMLAFTKIGDAGMYYLKDLTKMTQLSLRATCVSDLGIAQLLNMNKLEVLILARSYVGNNGLRALSQLGSLRFLNVFQLQNATQQGICELEHMLPSVRILSII